jgi:hypothetical protein
MGGHFSRYGRNEKGLQIFIIKPKKKRPFGSRREDNFKMNLKKNWCKNFD